VDKEQLYDDSLKLKKLINATKDENLKLRTRVTNLEVLNFSDCDAHLRFCRRKMANFRK
jgi:hypothetical protein